MRYPDPLPASTPGTTSPSQAAQAVLGYHLHSSHRFEAYAPGPATLDWDAQPAPFRSYPGAPICALPLEDDLRAGPCDPGFAAVLRRPFDALGETVPALPPSRASLGLLLHLSCGLTAWKSYGPDRWALRANPSSGNLHPVEAWVIARGIDGLPDGVHHYRPEDHVLELRARDAGTGHPPSLCVALSCAMWRESWKYGGRAFRYCQLDVGHALAALGYAAALLGWRLVPQPAIGHAELAARLGLDREQDYPAAKSPHTEREEPELVLAVDFGAGTAAAEPAEWLAAAARADWFGHASPIDPRPYHRWAEVETVAAATRRGSAPARPETAPRPRRTARTAASSRPAVELVLGRRSAQRFDPGHRMARADLLRLLAALAPGAPPLDGLLPAQRAIDVLLFVHRVEGLEPGLYLLPRHPSGNLATTLAGRFPRVLEPGPIEGSPLRLLLPVDPQPLRRLSRSLHCHQDIAASACLAIGFIAELDRELEADPGAYRDLHRAAGLLGQIAYLEAEAAGLRGTGIGCFFDEPVRQSFGLEASAFRSLYHFTIGMALDDPRIETAPAYAADRLRYLDQENPAC